MKLCPQCEFIYEDDQNLCDMDGEALVYDNLAGGFADIVPALRSARPQQSRLRIMVMASVAVIVLTVILSFTYTSSLALYSNLRTRSSKSEAPDSSRRQPKVLPIDKSSLPTTIPSQSSAKPGEVSEPATPGNNEVPDRLVGQSAPSQLVLKSTDKTLKGADNQSEIARRLTPRTQLSPLPQVPPLRRLPAANPVATATVETKPKKLRHPSQKLLVTNQKSLILEVKPVSGTANKRSQPAATPQ